MTLLAAIALVLAQGREPVAATEPAFNARYEFNLRLRAFDRAWLASPGTGRRAASLRSLGEAGDALRAGESAEAARCVERARYALVPTSERQSDYDQFSVVPEYRLCDAGDATLRLMVSHLYEQGRAAPSGSFSAGISRAREPRVEVEAPWNGPFAAGLALEGVPPGDHEAWSSFREGDLTRSARRMTISIVEKRDERLAALEKAVAALTEKAPRLERETASSLLALLTSLAARSTEETDYPGARLLAEAEQVVAAAAKGERWYGPEHAGEFFLTLPTGSTTTRARILVPEGLSNEKPAPLVVALHGRVFSEHTWFECYGAGKAPKECAQRKWLFAAPRLDQSPPPSISSIVDALASAYPVGRSKVFLVGHSMGGGIGLRAVRESPKSFRAFAAIGAGQALDHAAALKDLPIFIAAGDHDFAREGAQALHASLTAAGSTRSTLKIYPNAEHWMTVADSLPDVFAFFDATLR